MCARVCVRLCVFVQLIIEKNSQSANQQQKNLFILINQRTWESIHRQNCTHIVSVPLSSFLSLVHFVCVCVCVKSPHRRQNNTHSVKLTLKAFLIAHLTLQMFNLLTSSVRGTKPFNRPSSLLCMCVRASMHFVLLSPFFFFI